MALSCRKDCYHTKLFGKLSAMKDFVEKHRHKITGTISTFDRIIFKGYLPIGYLSAAGMNFKKLLKAAAFFLRQILIHLLVCQRTGLASA